jgi:hypothetical protein
MENLTVATALEIRRPGGSWVLPTLETEPRVAKPPLAAWIAAASIRRSTLTHLDDADFAIRRAAYRSLAWDVRWTALLCSCLALLAVYDLGKTIAGPPIGLIAMIVAGSSLYFLINASTIVMRSDGTAAGSEIVVSPPDLGLALILYRSTTPLEKSAVVETWNFPPIIWAAYAPPLRGANLMDVIVCDPPRSKPAHALFVVEDW